MISKITLVLTLAFLFQMYGCASKEMTNARPYIAQSEPQSRVAKSENAAADATLKRIVIFDADIVLETSVPDTVHKILNDLAKKYDGYVLLSGNTNSSIRIPNSNLNRAIEDIGKLGKIVYKNVKGSDVTHEYRDLEIRLDNAERARQRYLELLRKAENVESALKVEKELERLNTEIDLLKGRLNRLSHLSEYSTISVTTKRKIRPGPLGYFFVGAYKLVEKLFVWSH